MHCNLRHERHTSNGKYTLCDAAGKVQAEVSCGITLANETLFLINVSLRRRLTADRPALTWLLCGLDGSYDGT